MCDAFADRLLGQQSTLLDTTSITHHIHIRPSLSPRPFKPSHRPYQYNFVHLDVQYVPPSLFLLSIRPNPIRSDKAWRCCRNTPKASAHDPDAASPTSSTHRSNMPRAPRRKRTAAEWTAWADNEHTKRQRERARHGMASPDPSDSGRSIESLLSEMDRAGAEAKALGLKREPPPNWLQTTTAHATCKMPAKDKTWPTEAVPRWAMEQDKDDSIDYTLEQQQNGDDEYIFKESHGGYVEPSPISDNAGIATLLYSARSDSACIQDPLRRATTHTNPAQSHFTQQRQQRARKNQQYPPSTVVPPRTRSATARGTFNLAEPRTRSATARGTLNLVELDDRGRAQRVQRPKGPTMNGASRLKQRQRRRGISAT